MNGDGKIRGADIKTNSKFLLRLENFWYHYKWATIITAFFVVVFLVCTLQMCSNEKEDVTVLYAGPIQLSGDEMEAVSNVLEFIMPEDFDGDGEKKAALVNYHIYSKEQIEEIEAQTDAAGVKGYVDRSYNSNNYDNFYNYVQTGDVSICLVDPSLYENLKERDRLMKLSDVLSEIPEAAFDDYGLTLGEMDVYGAYGAIRVLPEDTVICILRPLVVGKSSKEKMYAREKDMFVAISEYESDEK